MEDKYVQRPTAPTLLQGCSAGDGSRIPFLAGNMGCEYYTYYKYYSKDEARDKCLIVYILSIFKKKKEEDIDPIVCNTL